MKISAYWYFIPNVFKYFISMITRTIAANKITTAMTWNYQIISFARKTNHKKSQ